MMNSSQSRDRRYEITSEIAAQVRVIRGAVRRRGADLFPPLLMLGTSERVGSNWISDTLRPVMAQHNEPFRQQLGAAHPLSPLNPAWSASVAVARAGQPGAALAGELRRRKYVTSRQVVKETNLFFALPGLSPCSLDARSCACRAARWAWPPLSSAVGLFGGGATRPATAR